jgi:adenylate cyclase
MALEIPAIIYFSSQTGEEVAMVVVLIAILAPNATAAFFIYLILEYLLRPIARSAAISRDSGMGALPRPAVSLRRKLMFGLPIVNFMTAYVSVALSGNATSVSGRLFLGVAAALAVTLTVSLVLTITLARSFNDPIDELVAATDRVASGDLSSRVLVFAVDEMGVLASGFNQMVEGLAERERIQQIFGTYVDKEVAEHILRNGTSLGGEQVEVTMMFIDIRGFTAYAERAAPPAVVATVNRLFERAVPVVHSHGGHIDKFVGDGLLAVFGAPRRQSDHAEQALAAARQIAAAVQEEFDDTVEVGIGLNSGNVIAGNVGGGGRFEYSVIGDAVNVAARVESATRQTGDTVLISENTWRLLGEAARTSLEERASVPLKGRSGPVALYGGIRDVAAQTLS